MMLFFASGISISRDTDGNSGSRGVMESHIFNIIQHDGCSGVAVHPIAPVDNLHPAFSCHRGSQFPVRIRIRVSVYKSQVLRNLLVENKSSHRGLYQLASCIFFILIHPYFYFRVKTHFMVLVSHQHFVDICEILCRRPFPPPCFFLPHPDGSDSSFPESYPVSAS